MKRKYHFLQNGKRALAVGLSATMMLTMAPVNVLTNEMAAVYASEENNVPNIFEDFNELTGTDGLLGTMFGSPTLAIEEVGVDGTKALVVSGRTENYYAYAYNVNALRGNTIKLTAKVKVAADNGGGPAPTTVVPSVEPSYVPSVEPSYVPSVEPSYVPSEVPTTVVPTTEVPTTVVPTTVVPESPVPSELPTSEAATEPPVLSGVSTEVPTSEVPTSEVPTSEVPTSEVPTSVVPTSEVPPTAVPGIEFKATLKTTKSGAEDAYETVAENGIVTDDFVTVTGEYTIPLDADSAVIYFEAPENVSYILDDVEIEVQGEYVDPTTQVVYADISDYAILKDLYSEYFKMGVACEAMSHWDYSNPLNEIGNEHKEALIKKEFNSITFGNELKPAYNMGWNSPEAEDEKLPFVIDTSAKEMLDWAKINDIKVRGHVLVWHSQCADEAFCKDYNPVYIDENAQNKVLDPSCYVSKDVLQKRLESYIDSTMKYMYANGYGDTIYAWDVVNEAVEPGTNDLNLRNSYWYQIMGTDFIYYSFKYAREYSAKYAKEYAKTYGVNPEDEAAVKGLMPKLFYNDYNEFQEAKCDAIINILTETHNNHNIKAEGLIDGIGMQSHLADNTNIDSFITAMKRYNEAVGEVHITELDVAETSTGVNADYYQAVFYKSLFEALIKAVKDGVNLTSVTIWGLTDDNSWKKESSPLVFKKDLSKKLAFDGIVYAKTGEELPEPAYVKPDFSDMIAEFDDAEDLCGFGPRGDSKLEVQSDVVFDGAAALKVSGRQATWNGASFDVSRFAGQTIEISAWVKSKAKEVKISADIDGKWPNITAIDTSSNEWVQIIGKYAIPKELNGLHLYFETGDTSDIYIDAVRVKLVGLDDSFEDAANIASPRGVGHMPVISVVDEDSCTGDHALKVDREAQDATVKFDVSKHIGQKVQLSAWVKTQDNKIMMGLDGDEPLELASVDSEGEWTEITATTTLSSELTSANIYIETSGNSEMLIDDFKLELADFEDDLENGNEIFTTRWEGAGTLQYVEDGESNHAVKLTGKDETYYGIVFDLQPYIGNEVEISCDVKTDDDRIRISGVIDGVWPNYLDTPAQKGEYTHVATRVKIPSDYTSLRAYIETSGKSDIYVDNFKIRRVKVNPEYKVTFDATPGAASKVEKLCTEGYITTAPEIKLLDEKDEILGWYFDKSFKEEWNFNCNEVYEPTTLYAKRKLSAPQDVKVTSITLNKTAKTLSTGTTTTIKATVAPTNATNKKVTFTSSNKKVATVDAKGLVRAIAPGKAVITCKATDGSGKKATCTITVIQKVTKITLNKKSVNLDPKAAVLLKATVTPSNASNKGVTWSSSNTKVAKVDSNGRVTAVKAGDVVITCKAKDGSGVKATCKVHVYTNTERFVVRIYTKALNRQPDAAGLTYWTKQIDSKKMKPVDVAGQLIFSKEFTDKKLSNTEYVKVLYRVFMGREADKGGLNYWVGQLKSGKSRKDVMKSFAGCKEFQDIVKGFGL